MKNSIMGLLLALLAVGMAGCGSSNDFNDISGQQGNPGQLPPTNSTFLRLAHLSPNAPNVDILVNGTQQVTNAPFTTVSNYLQVPAGPTRIEVRATGTTADLIDATPNLAANAYTTVAATGLAENIGATVLADDVTPTAATLKVRFFHAVPNVGPLTLTDGNGVVLAGPQTFGTASLYEIVPSTLQTKTYQFRDSQNKVVAEYDTVRGGNNGLVDSIKAAVTTAGLNTTVIATGDAVISFPVIVALDQANAGGTTFISDPIAVVPAN